MCEFKEGDIVRLKSGGPPMTVELVELKIDQVMCAWFDDRKQIQHCELSPNVLEKVREAVEHARGW